MKYDGLVYRLGDKVPVKRLSDLKAGESIRVEKASADGWTSCLFTVYRPPRKRDESPIGYYKRTGCVDDRYHYRHNGRYYCNPAHCRQTWVNKEARDKHLDAAYGALM